MPSKTLAPSIADLVLFEVDPAWSRDKVLYGSGNLVPLGTVLAKNASGEYNPVNFAGANGAQLAIAVAAEKVDASAAAKKGTAMRRGCVLETSMLIWPAGATDAQKASATASLDALGIVTRAAL